MITQELQELVGINVAELPNGSQLRNDLFSERGLMLLSAGSTVTPEIKNILASRGIERVQIHPEDAAALFNSLESVEDALGAQADDELPERPDETLDSGLFSSLEDSGPAMRDSIAVHRRTPYDLERNGRVSAQHREASNTLDSMMRKALLGNSVDGRNVGRMTAASLGNMTNDCDNVLAVATSGDNKGVSEQSLQTAFLSMAIGIEMGLDAESIRIIGAAGLVSDWGMMHLPEDIRGVKRQLDERDFFELQKVPIYTADMLLKTSALPRLVLPIAYQIHEKLDGTGYPRGRDTNNIHPFAKLIHVADLYTALTAPGPGRRPAMPYAAMEIILREAGKQTIDARVARALLRVLSLFPIGSYVALSDRTVGRVLRRNGANYSSPIVHVVLDANGHSIAPDRDDAIVDPDEAGLGIVRALPSPGRNELSSAELLQLPQ
ncbi:MAG TPA: HD domain-containing phosphohydrolase [Thermoguttaceae bacterium]|nr:HD domain-containing phosphohydrolase [Thermoguttaceae bacterium]